MLTGLLDVPYRKSFALLEELLERREAEEQTLAISTLATQLKMQQNTILQSVALLQTEIEKNGWENLFSLSANAKEITFWFAPYFQLSFLMPYFVKKSFAYQVLTYAFNHNAIDSKHFEKVLEISSSTFTRKIGQLNQWLQKYQIEINLKRTNVLVGKEKDIRIFFMMLFWNNYSEGDWPLHTITKKEVHSLFRRLKHSVSFNTTQDFTKDLIFSAVILARWKEGFFIKETFVEEEAIVNPFVNLSEFELFFKEEALHQVPTKFIQKEGLLAFFLLTISVSYATQDVLEIPAARMHMVQLLGSPIKEIIYQLTSFYQIKLTFHEYLYLYTSIQNLSVFFKTFVTIANPFVQESFLKEALQKNPSLYKDVKRLTIEMLPTLMGNEKLLVDCLFILFCTLKTKSLPPIRVLVRTNQSNLILDTLYEKLSKAVDKKLIFVASPEKPFDVIITDIFSEVSVKSTVPTYYVDFSASIGELAQNLENLNTQIVTKQSPRHF